mgnify:CR=1 FL=1
MATFAPPPGTADIFPEEARRWRNLEAAAGTVFSRYGYGELRTPIFEYTEVFQRGLGDETEVVQKEMYTFLDRGGRSLTLRPEGTAGVMRALSNTDVLNGVEQRVYYHGPMFRGERPAAGRRRQFHQIGVENVGRIAPLIDAECIAMLMEFLREIGIPDAKLSINTRGVMPDRGPAGQLLRDYFGSRIHEMCDDCKARLERNVWRILDCKQEACRKFVADAPDYVASFSAESRAYFDEVKAALTALGVEYTVDPLLVRGLDYYTKTVFEIIANSEGYSGTVCGGGRYDGLLEQLGGPKLPGIGFGMGMERLLLVAESFNPIPEPNLVDIYIAPVGDEARNVGLKLAGELRKHGVKTEFDHVGRSFKAQFKYADKLNARFVAVIGEDEVKNGVIKLKNMADGTETALGIEGFAEKAAELVK